LSPLQMMYNCW